MLTLRRVILTLGLVGCAERATEPDPQAMESRIAFTVSYPSYDSMPLYTVRADGSDLKLVLSGKGVRYGASWSPDRSRLVYIYNSTDFSDSFEVRVVGADGSGEHTILGPGRFFAPDWSPRGTHIVLSQGQGDGTQRLVTVEPDGSDLTIIGTREDWDADPTWSPDGQRIAFVGNCHAPGCNRFVMDLWVMNADGTSPQRLTTGNAIDDDVGEPVWSPDGQWLAFHMTRGFATDVYRIRASGADLERLTSAANGESYLSPTYSPGGRYLAYSHWSINHSLLTKLYVADADGSNPTRLPLSVGEAVAPAWAR